MNDDRFLARLRGFVRPVVTITGFVALTASVIAIVNRTGIVPDWYVSMVSMMVAFWFATRNPGNGKPA